jgi:FkbM family methyltransferase
MPTTTQLQHPTTRARWATRVLAGAGLLDRSWPRGYTALSKVVGRMLGDDDTLAEVGIPRGGTFSFPVRDFYYSRLLLPGYRYEPDLDDLLDRMRGWSVDVVDCGANMGYWTIQFGVLGGRVVAVEASASTFEHLERNVARNPTEPAVELVHAAVSDRSGDVRELFTYVGHAGATIERDNVNSDRSLIRTEVVTTVTIDELVERHGLRAGEHLLVKLDVEGVELPALQGGHAALEGGALIVYEEFARNPTTPATDWLLEQAGIAVWLLDPDGGAPQRIGRGADLDPIKRARPRSGLNLVACRPETAERLGPGFA